MVDNSLVAVGSVLPSIIIWAVQEFLGLRQKQHLVALIYLVVMGRKSCPRGCEFESQCRIIFSLLGICCKIILMSERPKKRPQMAHLEIKQLKGFVSLFWSEIFVSNQFDWLLPIMLHLSTGGSIAVRLLVSSLTRLDLAKKKENMWLFVCSEAIESKTCKTEDLVILSPMFNVFCF